MEVRVPATQPRLDGGRCDTCDELTERRERRTGRDAGEESEREWDQHPPLAHHEKHQGLHDNAGRYEARRGLVDRVGETHQCSQAHEKKISVRIPINKVGIHVAVGDRRPLAPDRA